MNSSMLSDLRNWIREVGIELAPNVTPVQTATGLGLATSTDKETGLAEAPSGSESLVVKVPESLTLNETRIAELAEHDSELKRWIEVDNCTGKDLLHRGMLYLWLKRPDSEWGCYFKALPTEINLPFSYSIKEMQGLDFSAVSLHHTALKKRLDIEKSYERFQKSGVSGELEISLIEWLLPHQWISSRGLSHPVTDAATIVPTIDLCNHSTHSSNVRYDVDEDGNFELRALGSLGPEKELLLNYGSRGTSEFVFNYGFIPEDLTEDDFDQVFKVFDPADSDVRQILDPGFNQETEDDDSSFEKSLSYDLLLEFFSEENAQVLLLVRLPKWIEEDKSRRFRFRSNFIMAVACFDHFVLRDVEGGQALFLHEEQVLPENVFELVTKLGDRQVLAKAKMLVSNLCRYFGAQVSAVSDNNDLTARLARSEAAIYRDYVVFNAPSVEGLS